MRDSNCKSTIANKATVTITTGLYDRRALDVTSDKPLVNSLNHLTYLISSLAKVREILSLDGGIERLIEILHECNNACFSISDVGYNNDKKLLIGWKWTLAFQCLVLMGTRGTEKIRQGLVKAGILPIIATVLDNYISMHEKESPLADSRQVVFDLHSIQRENLTQHAYDVPVLRQGFQDVQTGNHEGYANERGPDVQAEALTFASTTESGHAMSRVFTPEIDHLRNLNRHTSHVEDDFQQRLGEDHTGIGNDDRREGSLFANVVPESPFLGNQTCVSEEDKHTGSIDINGNSAEQFCMDYDCLSIEQLISMMKSKSEFNDTKKLPEGDLRRRCLIITLLKKLRKLKQLDDFEDNVKNECKFEMDNTLQFLSDMYCREEKANNPANIAPRNFTESGVVVPRDDDVVWTLQLLAYISKYPYMKEVLQTTHIVSDLSIKEKFFKFYIEKQIKTKLKETLNLNPKLIQKAFPNPSGNKNTQILELHLPKKSTTSGLLDSFCGTYSNETKGDIKLEDLLARKSSSKISEASGTCYDFKNKCPDEYDMIGYKDTNEDNGKAYFQFLDGLQNEIIKAESIQDELDRKIALFRLSEDMNRCIELESEKLSSCIRERRAEEKNYINTKWNYDSYDRFDIDDDTNFQGDSDYDESLMELKKINLFALVEKFTFLIGTDMHYWSGVIMRNSCRRNELKGGVRQCGNLECGKWENYRREFSKCRRCKRTKYCSKDCQMHAWNSHRNWCIPSSSSSLSSGTGPSNCNNNSGVLNQDDHSDSGNNFSSGDVNNENNGVHY